MSRPTIPSLPVMLTIGLSWTISSTIDLNAAPPVGPNEGHPQVNWRDAEDVVGQTASVVGRVQRVGHARRVHFLNFHATRRDLLTVVIYGDHLDLFPASLEQLYLHRIVRVHGLVTLYRGTPQVRVTSPTQIEVLTEWPALPTGTPSRSPPDGDQISVATFNVLNLFDDVDDPYTADEGTSPKSREELTRLARTIRKLNADVLALQEVESRGYLQRFVKVFLPDSGYRHVIHFEGNDLRGIDVALLSRFPVDSVTSYRHATFVDEANKPRQLSRDLLRATILPHHGPAFEIWCVHLKSNAEGRQVAEPIRWAEVRKIRQIYDQTMTTHPRARILLVGDLNDTLSSRSLRWLLGSPSHALKTLLRELPAEQHVTYNRMPHRSMIDFILASPQMADDYVPGSYRIVHTDLESSGSDHNPVIARFRPVNTAAD